MRRTGTIVAIIALVGSALVGSVLSVPAVAAPANPSSPAKPSGTAPSAGSGAAVRGAGPAAATLRSVPARPPAATAVAPQVKPAVTPQSRALPANVDPQSVQVPAEANGQVLLTVTGDPATVRTQATKLGGRVLLSAGRSNSVEVPPAAIGALGSAPGVGAVEPPVRAYVQDSTSQGVAKSGAGTWQAAGDKGAHTAVAIVDAGFANLAAEKAAGHITYAGYNAGNCPGAGTSGANSQHGTAVAEIVHQMAPAASIYLYCVQDTVAFVAAARDIVKRKIMIASSSLGFPADGRGDGSGGSATASGAVRSARLAGVLWIQSAGNNAREHWSGRLTDSDRDGHVDIGCSGRTCPEVDSMFMPPNYGSAEVVLKWDQWPVSADTGITLVAYESACTDDNFDDCTLLTSQSVRHRAGRVPALGLTVDNPGYFLRVDVAIKISAAYPSVAYDLSYWGEVSDPSYLASWHSSQAAAGSVTEPANSPYAFAVGAADVTRSALEAFSSRGPTIDGRTKPDITGWDCVRSNLPAFSSPENPAFCGTSAAAPHVAGAAVLVRSARPSMDATQIETFLQQRANSGKPLLPPSRALGYGRLALGSTAGVAPPPGSGYVALSPRKVLDTRTRLGGHHRKLGPGSVLTLRVAHLPSTATAVALNVTALTPTATTSLGVFQGGTGWPGTTNLRLSRADPSVTAFVTVSLDRSRHTVSIRNARGHVNVLASVIGYFRTTSSTGFVPVSPRTVLDTRTRVGGHHAALRNRSRVTINPHLPAAATAAVVNLTALGVTGHGYFGLSNACSNTTYQLTSNSAARTVLAIVRLNPANRMCLRFAGTRADARVQVVGYFAPRRGYRFHPVLTPTRIVDTARGIGGRPPATLRSGRSSTYYGAGLNGVPLRARAMFVGLTDTSATSTGYLAPFAGSRRPHRLSAGLTFSRHRITDDSAVIGLSGRRFGVFNSHGRTGLTVDLYGYFL
jgi:hypothetical protein